MTTINTNDDPPALKKTASEGFLRVYTPADGAVRVMKHLSLMLHDSQAVLASFSKACDGNLLISYLVPAAHAEHPAPSFAKATAVA